VILPPCLAMLLGACVLPFFRGKVQAGLAILSPLLSLALVWTLEVGDVLRLGWLETPAGVLSLDLVQISLPSRVFATIFCVTAAVGALFAANRDRRIELPAALFYAGSAVGVCFAGDLLTMFVFWELMAIGSTVVVWAGGQPGSARAGMRYVGVHLVGGVVLMAGILLHYHQSGFDPESLAIGADPLRSDLVAHLSRLDSPEAWLILVGILVNAGAPLLGAWLPDAYPEGSPSGTVFLSAFTTKTAVFVAMMCFAGCELLVWVGCTMAIYGIVYAILENDLRRILAYSIVNQVGFMICGIGLAAGDGVGAELALCGAAAHAFAHIVYKALLLMSAGSVLHATGKRRCTDLGGLFRTMPVTAWCGVVGALTISAFPGTGGFTTKTMITAAAAAQDRVGPWLVLEAASALAFVYVGIRFPWLVFFGRDSGLRPPEVPWNMRAAMMLLAAACVVLGIATEPLYAILPYEPLLPGAGGGEEAYPFGAYKASKVLAQLQLLLFGGMVFFLLLPMVRPARTITLDGDWFYRALWPRVWRGFFLGPLRWLGERQRRAMDAIPRLAAATIERAGRMRAANEWSIGAVVALVTVLLCVLLVLHYAAGLG